MNGFYAGTVWSLCSLTRNGGLFAARTCNLLSEKDLTRLDMCDIKAHTFLALPPPSSHLTLPSYALSLLLSPSLSPPTRNPN